jgi:hypothetical protein
VDQGASYGNAETVKTAFKKSGGLMATTLHVYNPNRSNRFCGKPKVSIESVLGTILDRQDMSLTACKQSSYRTGFKIAASKTFIFKKIADYKRGLQVGPCQEALFLYSVILGCLFWIFVVGVTRSSKFIV